jgi:deoxyadenosine/deoxycytidine kinase
VNKLISIVGASGVGKTTLVRALAKTGKFTTAFEPHAERPFQALFKQDKKHGLANQIDYLLLRAEQEKELRAASQIGLMDGGLDLDFHGFTRLFLSRKLLAEPEYDLCQRLYTLIRATLPRPELIVRLVADEETVAGRLSTRDRINIASVEDTTIFSTFLEEWLAFLPSNQILTLDVSHESEVYETSVRHILEYINASLA